MGTAFTQKYMIGLIFALGILIIGLFQNCSPMHSALQEESASGFTDTPEKNRNGEIPGDNYLPIAKSYQCDPGSPVSLENRIRRLTRYELINTLSDIFSDNHLQNAEVTRWLSAIPEEYLGKQPENFNNQIQGIEVFFELAESLVTVALADPNWVSREIPRCAVSLYQ